jgi:hypothetical protein
MDRNDENMRFCRAQIRRFENTAYYAGLSSLCLADLATSLCDSNDSQEGAAEMVFQRLRDTSITPRGEIRGSVCPSAADFAAMAELRRAEARAAIPWKPDRSMKDERSWSPEERRRHDEWWAGKLADFEAQAKRHQAVKGGFRRATATIGNVIPMAPNKTEQDPEREPGDEPEGEEDGLVTAGKNTRGDFKR